MAKTDVLFWNYPHGNDTAEHARYNVGPASDYATPSGTPVAAPFAGRLSPYWTREGGNSLELTGADFILRAQHLERCFPAGQYGWRDQIGITDNTGTSTSGPHIHAYIIVRATGKRISFYEWLRDYVRPQAATTPAPAPAPAPASNGIVGKTFTTSSTGAYWYTTDADAANLRSPHGDGTRFGLKRYTREPMLLGAYPVVGEGVGGAFRIKAHDGSLIWVSGQLRGRIG